MKTTFQSILQSLRRPTKASPNAPTMGDEANPPNWPHDDDNAVVVVNAETKAADVQQYQDAYDSEAETFRSDENHFSNKRTAVLFEKGTYSFDLQVGYYCHVAGLGRKADDVVFENTKYGVYCPAYNKDVKIPAVDDKGNKYDVRGISLDTFWRSAENFANNTSEGLLWAVSQAAPIRRVHAMQTLRLYDETAYSSGGHMTNAQIDKGLFFGTQQQFCCRSVTMPEEFVELGAWSNVFVDCLGAPEPSNGSAGAAVTIYTPTVTVEKPYVIKDEGMYYLRVPLPRLRSEGALALGPDLAGDSDEERPFERVYVAWAKCTNYGDIDTDVASKINRALDQGKDVVLSPGIYHLNAPITMKQAHQVLLGIGMATLVAPTDGSPCIQVDSNVEGVRVAGIMFEASKIPDNRQTVASFIEWGVEGVTGDLDPGKAENPGVLSDVFCRVGGSSLDRTVETDVMVRIHSGHVLGDNLWLWRADHVSLGPHELANFPPLEYHQTVEGEVPVRTGLEVNGDHVTIHGLAVEHTTEHQVVWRGEHGNVQFYQCELPYDVSSSFGVKNYLGYLVDATVMNHHLGGAGCYSNFRDSEVLVKTAIQHPRVFDLASGQVVNPFTKHLNNKGVIMTVVTDGKQNGGGPALPNAHPSRFPSL